ncbi:glutamate synthase-related protein [Archaeoglobus sp.]
MKSHLLPDFIVERIEERCNKCGVCVKQCPWGVFSWNEDKSDITIDYTKCVGCQRCVIYCPNKALIVKPYEGSYRPNSYWNREVISDIKKQAEQGGVILIGTGSDKPYKVYFDHILLNASQVTNPSIDPLREPMELRTFIGRKPDKLEIDPDDFEIKTEISPNLVIETPIMFAGMSYGALSYNAFLSLAMAAKEFGTKFCTGEGGLPRDMREEFGEVAIVQCASGRFGVDPEYLNCACAIEIKIGQGAKPGIGGHLPGEKVSRKISETRMIPEGTDALSPAPHHDIYSIEDLAMLIYALKEATNYEKPVFVKIAAVHNVAAIASGIVRAGADAIVIDGFRGGTGATPKVMRDHVGIPIEMAIAVVDQRLREEGIRHKCSIIASGGIRCSADVVKAIALGADAVYIGTAALIAMGCTMCQKCYTGKCAWGICTQDENLTKRLNPKVASKRVVNLLRAWSLEIKEMMGAMGINAIESLRGNREHLRGIGLEEWELRILGIKGAGEGFER